MLSTCFKRLSVLCRTEGEGRRGGKGGGRDWVCLTAMCHMSSSCSNRLSVICVAGTMGGGGK